jgi:hypothetical protein
MVVGVGGITVCTQCKVGRYGVHHSEFTERDLNALVFLPTAVWARWQICAFCLILLAITLIHYAQPTPSDGRSVRSVLSCPLLY